MKTCSKCKETKDESQFFRKTSSSDGLQSWCKECAQVENKVHLKTWYSRHTEVQKRRALNAYFKNKESYFARNRIRYASNPVHRAQCIGRAMLRNRQLRTQFDTLPPREQQAIIEFYLNCPHGYEVDHIYPIIHGGLHCLSNLQYLPAFDNGSKRDKIPPNIDVDGTPICWS